MNIHRQLTEAGKILGIQVLDHVIVTRKGYYSLKEAGLLVSHSGMVETPRLEAK